MTFIVRMVQHIFPKGFTRISYYGLHATCRASRIREKLKNLLKRIDEPVADTYGVMGSSYKNRIKRVLGLLLYFVLYAWVRLSLREYNIQSMDG